MAHEYYTSSDLRKLGIKSVGENVRISKKAEIVGLENIKIGRNVRIDSFVVLLCGRGELQIGSNVHIEPLASIVSHHGIYIGDFCTISHGVRLFTASANYGGEYFTNGFPNNEFQKPIIGSIVLGNHVIIGANSVVLPNLKLGDGVGVGALSFVRQSLEPWTIFAGNPLRELGKRARNIERIGDSITNVDGTSKHFE